MMTPRRVLTVIAVFGLLTGPCAAEDQAPPPETGQADLIHVVDVRIVGSNQVIVGTNTMALGSATNLLATYRDTVDVVAVHGSMTGNALPEIKAPALVRLAAAGVPLLIVENEGEYTWQEQSAQDGIRTITVGTDQLAAVRRLWTRRRTRVGELLEPDLQTSVEWDTATGTYGLSRVELGLFGRRVWFMHALNDTEDEPDNVGIQFKKEW